VPVIDLMHDAPAYDPRAAAYLLAALAPECPRGSVLMCVVDPGVGTDERKPAVVRADGRWFVGPGNGLFNVIASRAKTLSWWDITWSPDRLSPSFHGRDLFAPVAAGLALDGEPPGTACVPAARLLPDWPAELFRVIYVDHFGNAMTGIRATSLDPARIIEVNGYEFSFARTFAAAPAGRGFWYANSNGLVEIAINQGSATDRYELKPGNEVTLGDDDDE
jgi:S-adenosylmethionine hydrolase